VIAAAPLFIEAWRILAANDFRITGYQLALAGLAAAGLAVH